VILLVACARESVVESPCALEYAVSTLDGAREIGVMLPSASGAYDLHAELRWPDNQEGAPWPVAVVIQGAWDVAGTPVTAEVRRPSVGEDIVAVHVDLPGGGFTAGSDDKRGDASRQAVATALRWAAGGFKDQGGCSVQDRAPGSASGRAWLMGLSNGGNLALATLADPALELPPVGGAVLWESPVAPAFVNVTFGNDPTVYTPGACSRGEGGITCEIDASGIVEGGSLACFDVDADAACTNADIILHGAQDPETGKEMLAPEVREVLGEDAPSKYAGIEATQAWWPARDGSAAVAGAVALQPDLAWMLVASEVDHVLDWSDHPHVFGLGEALQAEGARWTRLNPGAEWLAGPEARNEPDAPFSMANPTLSLLEEDTEEPLDYALGAALRELYDRAEAGDW
jgi:hypothetical protein